MNRIEGTPNVNKGGNHQFFVIEGMINMSREDRETFKSTPAFTKSK